MASTDLRARARDSIVQLAIELHLPIELELLSERWNTVVRLGDSGVIAKAATLAELVISEPRQAFKMEVDVCRVLEERGAPVHRPYGSGLYEINGIPITMWHEVRGEMGESSEQELVESLASLHRIGNSLLNDRVWFSTITTHFADVMPKLRDRRVIDSSTLAILETHYKKLMNRISAAGLAESFIHGDAQRKNAMATDSGAVWIDFEECSYGPVAWDLACLTMHRRFDTDRVLDRYAQFTGSDRITNADIDMLKQLRELEGLTWMLAIQHEREPVFAVEATNLLRDVLAAASVD